MNIMDLIEISIEDIIDTARRLEKADDLSVTSSSEDGMYDRFVVKSGPNEYVVVRVGLMAGCTCPGFQAGHRICKHIALTMPPVCRTCVKQLARERGGQCSLCGPGEPLPLGTRFTNHKYYGKRPIFEVVETQADRVIAHDITTPPSNERGSRTNFTFPLNVLDRDRANGSLVIVDPPPTL